MGDITAETYFRLKCRSKRNDKINYSSLKLLKNRVDKLHYEQNKYGPILRNSEVKWWPYMIVRDIYLDFNRMWSEFWFYRSNWDEVRKAHKRDKRAEKMLEGCRVV